MRVWSKIAACLVTILALTGPAGAYIALNQLRVNPVDQTSFEVLARGPTSNGDYWCAASDYAFRILGAPTTASIYITRGRGKAITANRRSAVIFSTDPPPDGPAPPSYSLSVTTIGENLSVAQARFYCFGSDRRVFF
jgi:hypothetical protein